jgi:hypothetical protein
MDLAQIRKLMQLSPSFTGTRSENDQATYARYAACPLAGTSVDHINCGWCFKHNHPRILCRGFGDECRIYRTKLPNDSPRGPIHGTNGALQSPRGGFPGAIYWRWKGRQARYHPATHQLQHPDTGALFTP